MNLIILIGCATENCSFTISDFCVKISKKSLQSAIGGQAKSDVKLVETLLVNGVWMEGKIDVRVIIRGKGDENG